MPMGGTPPEFKSPQMMPTMTEPPGPAPKKKRRNAASAAAPPPAPPPVMDMMPPPLSGYGDTIVASNPFDDMPSHHPLPPMMMPPQRGMPPGGPPPHGMNSPMMPGPMSPMMRSPLQESMMGPGGPMQMPPMGMMSPMGQQQMQSMSHQQQPPPQQPSFAQMAPKPMPVTTGKVCLKKEIVAAMKAIVSVDTGLICLCSCLLIFFSDLSTRSTDGVQPSKSQCPSHLSLWYLPQRGARQWPGHSLRVRVQLLVSQVRTDCHVTFPWLCNPIFWFDCRICTGLTEAAYQLLTAEVYAEWVCDKCLASKNIPLVKCKP